MMVTLNAVLNLMVQIITGAQAEFILFVAAICMHSLVFGKYRLPARSLGNTHKLECPSSLEKESSLHHLNRLAGYEDVQGSLACPAVMTTIGRIKDLVAEHRLQDAKEAFYKSRVKPACLYNVIIEACAACKDYAAAKNMMEEATQSGVADITTYNTMMKVYIGFGALDSAQNVFRSMLHAGVKPTCATFNELINAKVRRDVTGMWELVDEMERFGVKPNHVTASIVLKSIQTSSDKNVDRAMKMVYALSDTRDEVLFSSAIEACSRANRVDLLRKLLANQGTSAGVVVTGVHAYVTLIRACGILGDVQKAWNVWHEMFARQISPSTVAVGCMVETLVTNGDVEGAHQLICELLDKPHLHLLVNSVPYCSILKGFSHQKQFDKVWQVYEEMQIKGIRPSLTAFNALIDACARCGKMGNSAIILEDMAKHGFQPNVITCTSIIKGCCRDNQLDRAFSLLDSMQKIAEFTPDEVTWNTLLDGCARQGHYDRGMSVLEMMKKANVAPSNFTLSVLVKLICRAKKLDEAFALSAKIAKDHNLHLNVYVYNNLIQGCIQNKSLHRGLEAFGTMVQKKVSPDARTYTLLLRGCVERGSNTIAAGLLRMAVGLPGGHVAPNECKPLSGRETLPAELIEEILQAMARQSKSRKLAINLCEELQPLKRLGLPRALLTKVASVA